MGNLKGGNAMDNLERFFGCERIIFDDKSESDTWGGGDFDREYDHLLATYKVNENIIFVVEYENSLEHSMYKYYDEAFLKLGYYDKNGHPVAANLLLDRSSKDKAAPRNIVLFGALNIEGNEPNGVGTFEKDEKIYSGLFKDGKLHGFGVVFAREDDEIKFVDAGIFEDGNLSFNEIDKIVRLSCLNDFLAGSDKFNNSFKNAIMDATNQCDYDPNVLAQANK